MNTDLLIGLVPGLTVVFFLIGLYKTTLEKKVQAKEYIQDLLGEHKPGAQAGLFRGRDVSDSVLKKRKKGKDGQQSFMGKLEVDLERANLLLRPDEFLMVCAGTAVIAMLLIIVAFGQNLIIGIVLGAGCGYLPMIFLKVKAMLRLQKAIKQFSDILDAMVNGFKTGFGFSRAVQMVADNFDDPWGTEFGKMAAEMNLGASMEDALYSLSARVPSADIDLFVTALLIQKETGGNMAELLSNLSKTCRDRQKLFQKVGAISAQGKLSASIICCVPFVLCGMMFLFLPDAMIKFFTNPIGIVLLIGAGFWMVCGIAVLFKIVSIEV
jgi:tight adherence protein B